MACICALVGAGAPGLSTPCGELQPKPRHMLLKGSTGTSARAAVGANTAAAPASWRRVSCRAAAVWTSTVVKATSDERMVLVATNDAATRRIVVSDVVLQPYCPDLLR